MVGGEAEVETDEGQGEVQLAKRLIQHPAGEFGIPVIDGAEDDEDGSSIDNVVKVADDEIGIVNVDIKGNLRQGNAGDTAKNKVNDEGAGEKHGAVQGNLSTPEGG